MGSSMLYLAALYLLKRNSDMDKVYFSICNSSNVIRTLVLVILYWLLCRGWCCVLWVVLGAVGGVGCCAVGGVGS